MATEQQLKELDRKHAREHAEVLVDEVKRAGGPDRLGVWQKAGVGTRIYWPADLGFVSVGADGSVNALLRGKLTFDANALYKAWRQAWVAGLKAYQQALDARIDRNTEEREQLFAHENPPRDAGGSIPRAIVDRYRRFHGVEPEEIEDTSAWVPGDLVLLGECLQVEYGVIDKQSTKEGVYYHQHAREEKGSGPAVSIYRRARAGETSDLSYSSFPTSFMVLGNWQGARYLDAKGAEKRLAASSAMRSATPDGKRLCVIHPSKGLVYLVKGGKFRITDWMFD
jgi:hypothetical protein